MATLSQNKKIAISAVLVLFISFFTMLFFLQNTDEELRHGHVDVLHTQEEDLTDEDKLGYFLSKTEEPMVAVTPDAAVHEANNEFCDLLSVDCDDLNGQLLFDYVNSEDLSELFSDHSKTLQETDRIDGLGPYRMLKGDREILVMMSFDPILNEDQKVKYILLTAKDITEKATEINETPAEAEGEGLWLEHMYPKIKIIQQKDGSKKLVLDKLVFVK